MTENIKQTKKHKNKTRSILGWGATMLQLILSVIVMVLLVMSGMFPTLYLGAIGLIMAGLLVLTRWLMAKHSKGKFIAGIAIALIVCLLLGAISYYLFGVVKTLRSITDAKDETTNYGVYVLMDDKAQTISDAAGYTFGTIGGAEAEKTNQIVSLIEKDVAQTITTQTCEDMFAAIDCLKDKQVEAVVMNEAFLDTIAETEDYTNINDEIREIAVYQVNTKVTATVKNEDEPFVVFISGIDVAGAISTTSRSDVNILAVINPKTHQILLVSTPRDYFVPLSISNGVKDKLTHAGIYGINTSMDTLGMLYDTDIDYYFRINFSGFKDVINALGSVTVQSDYSFNAGGYSFQKGANTLNADAALAFARERHAFAEGDRQRGKDQMAVIEGVVNKMLSPAILNNYSELLNGLEGSFETNVPYSMVSGLVKDQLSSGSSWDIQQYSVNGTGKSSVTYSMPRQHAYVMVPDQDTVDQAKAYIDAVLNNEKIVVE